MYSCKNEINRLKQELDILKNIVNEVGAYIYTKDLNGCYTFANSLVLELFNSSLDEVLGKDDSHFFDLKISNELKKNDAEVLKYEKTIEKEELNIIKSTGEEKIYLTVKKPLYDENNNLIGMCGISSDITERKKLEKKFKEQKYLLDIILDNVDAYIYMKSEDRKFKYVNSKVSKLFGLDAKDIIGQKDTDVLPQNIADEFWEMDKRVFITKKTQTKEEVFYDDNGNERHYWSIKLPYKIDENTMSLIGLSTDITELQLLKEELRQQSITDYLTGAYNRRHFVETSKSEFNKAKRYNLDFSILILDIDWFKSINDSYGHLEGDKLLIGISKICATIKRKEDIFCRIGGEEFAFILPHTNITETFEFAKRLKKFNKNNQVDGLWIDDKVITFSIGISSLQSNDTEYEDIFARADKALYESKEKGRNCISIK